MDKVIVTGGSGLIGTNLVQLLLDKKIPVLNLDKSPPLDRNHQFCWEKGDILDLEDLTRSFRSFNPTHVVHLAARTDLDENRDIKGYAVNYEGTEKVLTAVLNTDSVRRILVASSMLVNRVGYRPKNDEDYSPPNLYAESKVLTETITRGFNHRCTWLIIRPTTIWGPWNFKYEENGFFKLIKHGLYFHMGRSRVMKTYGFAGNSVHQIYELLYALEDKVHGRTFYIGDPPIDLRNWTDAFSQRIAGRKSYTAPRWLFYPPAILGDILDSLGIRFPITTFRFKNMTADNIVDIQPTLDITGDLPFTLSEGVDRTLQWLKNLPECPCL